MKNRLRHLHNLIKRFAGKPAGAFGLLLALVLIISAGISPAYAEPIPLTPHQFWGTVTVNESAAPGLTVAAKIGGTQYGPTATTNASGQYSLQVPQDDPSTGTKEGGVKDDTVALFVGTTQVTTRPFAAGAISHVDLAITTTPPSVTTTAATSVTTNSATLNGDLTSLGEAGTVAVSFEWGETDTYGSETDTEAKTATGTFSAGIDSLTPGTEYYYRAKAAGGTAYGADMTFTTTAVPPLAVTTNAATEVTGTTATLNGDLTSLGEAGTVAVSFEWGETDTYGSETATEAKTATGTFSAGLPGLTPGTEYHYRAKAEGSTAYGTGMTFTTTIGPDGEGINRQVAASNDDCDRILEHGTPYFSLTLPYAAAGYYAAGDYKYGCGLRFLDITIPKGATITAAYLTFTCQTTRSGDTVKSRISAEDVDNAPTFADDGGAFDTRFNNHTTARVDWDSIPHWTVDTEYQSPEIKTVIQEIVNRAGWVSGNAVVLFCEDFDDRSSHVNQAVRQGYSYDGNTTKCARLHIEYSGGGGGTPTRLTPAINSVTFSWEEVTDATKYWLQVNTNSAFTGTDMLDADVGNVTSRQVTSLSGGAYYWRVKAYVDDTWGSWSSTGSVIGQ